MADETRVRGSVLFDICGGASLIIDEGLIKLLKGAINAPMENVPARTINGRRHLVFSFDSPPDKLMQPTMTVIREDSAGGKKIERAIVTFTLE